MFLSGHLSHITRWKYKQSGEYSISLDISVNQDWLKYQYWTSTLAHILTVLYLLEHLKVENVEHLY